MTLKARYPGRCAKCGGKINPGDIIDWNRDTKATQHIECPAKPVAQVAATVTTAPQEATIKLLGGEGYGCRGWQVGQTARNAQRNIEAGGPEYVTVLRAGHAYYREDGMSFGVGDEQGYTYWAECRPATDAEAAPLVAARAAREAKAVAQKRVAEIKQQIQAEGERPDGDNAPKGDRLMDTQNIRGGGDWFVVGPEHIWYVRNNGSDGDNWANNNVRTGGAGAMGWRIAATVELADEIRRLAAQAQ